MKEKNISNWEYKQELNGLLYFSQLTEELLFYYTIDSFKLPAHNINSLINEAIKTISHIENEILNENALNSIVDEIIDTINKDIVVLEILGTEYNMFLDNIHKSRTHKNEIKELLNFLKTRIVDKYFPKLYEILKEKIIECNYTAIRRLTKSFLIELQVYGYSVEYINLCATKIFQKHKVKGSKSFDDFLKLFEFEKKDYKVYFEVSPDILKINKYINKDFAKITDDIKTLNIDISSSVNKEFFKIGNVYCEISIDALDRFKAYKNAKYFINNIYSHSCFLVHKENYTINDEGVVFEDNKYYLVKNIVNPIHRRPDKITIKSFDESFQKILRPFIIQEVDDNSKQRVELAIQRHYSAIKSDSYENQLIDLWSGVELLIPIKLKNSENKINQIIKSMIPLITYNYVSKIINNIKQSLVNSLNKNEIKRIINSVDSNEMEAVLKILFVEEYKEKYEKIMELITKNILLTERIKYYKEAFSDSETIINIMLNHQERVAWQLKRIYRGRNLIIHAGKTPYQLETLIENLHFYFDVIIHLICENLEENKNITNVIYQFKYLVELNLKKLKKNKKNKCNYSDILLLK